MQTSEQTPPTPPNHFATRLPLLWLSLAFLAGILLAGQVTLPVRIWAGLAVAVLAFAILLRLLASRLSLPANIFPLALIPCLFFLGAARYQYTVPVVNANYIAWYNDREYETLVTATLIEPPDVRDTYINLRLQVISIDTGDEVLPVSGVILARVYPGQEFLYGDVVRLRGHLQTPPENEDFSYRDYLARQGIRAYMPDAEATLLPFTSSNRFLRTVYELKTRALIKIYQIFPEPEASLLGGILLGEDNGLSAELQQAFKNTGTAHIIAISGFNIAIIAALFVALFSRLLGTRKGTAVAIIGIIFYTVLIGASPSVVRAAIMGSLALFARQLGRRQVALNTLAFTAAVMAIFNPNMPWDVGFQLSFAATLGLVLYAQPFQEWAEARLTRFLPAGLAPKIASLLAEYVLFTLAAQLTTLPIMAYHFGQVSLVALLANPFILPAQPLVMILGGLAVLLSFINLPLGQVFAWIAWPFSAYTIRAVEFFDRFPHGVISLGDFSFLFVVLFYAILLALTFARPRVKQTLRAALNPSVILVALGVLTYLVWAAAFSIPDGRLHLTFLDVGSGDAILIQTPSGRTILVNGGPSPSKLSDALGRRLSPFDRSIDWLVVASPQEEQVAALPRLLDRYPVQNVLWSGNREASFSAGSLVRWFIGNDIPITQAYPGAALDLGSGARLEVRSVSERGAVLLITWNGFRALLPVGMNFDTLEELEYGKKIGPVTILLLADAGYAPANPPEWLAALHPQISVLSVQAGDPNGLPDQSVLDEFTGVNLLRTDQDGWIEFSTDGENLRLEVENK